MDPHKIRALLCMALDTPSQELQVQCAALDLTYHFISYIHKSYHFAFYIAIVQCGYKKAADNISRSFRTQMHMTDCLAHMIIG